MGGGGGGVCVREENDSGLQRWGRGEEREKVQEVTRGQ
jgi:hypothetical protein